jgi:hypothetical protein
MSAAAHSADEYEGLAGRAARGSGLPGGLRAGSNCGGEWVVAASELRTMLLPAVSTYPRLVFHPGLLQPRCSPLAPLLPPPPPLLPPPPPLPPSTHPPCLPPTRHPPLHDLVRQPLGLLRPWFNLGATCRATRTGWCPPSRRV